MRPRAHRTELEKLTASVVIRAVIETTPGLRDSIRAVLDKGASPADVRKRWGAQSLRGKTYGKGYTTALTVDWIVDEWERDKGLIEPDESIDRVK